MAELNRKFSESVKFIGINVWVNESREKIDRYLRDYRIDFTNAIDYKSELIRSFGVLGTPTHVIINRSGIVEYIGAQIPPDFTEHLDDLMR